MFFLYRMYTYYSYPRPCNSNISSFPLCFSTLKKVSLNVQVHFQSTSTVICTHHACTYLDVQKSVHSVQHLNLYIKFIIHRGHLTSVSTPSSIYTCVILFFFLYGHKLNCTKCTYISSNNKYLYLYTRCIVYTTLL